MQGGGYGGGGVRGGAATGAEPAAPAATKPGDTLALGKSSNGSVTYRSVRPDAEGAAVTGLDEKAPAQGYRSNSNYAQQARVVKGRAFYQNGNTWTDSTASTKKDLKSAK